MKIFLTGATGFVGSVVAEKLKGKGYKVSALARNDDAAAKLEAKNIEVLRGELSDFDVLKQGAGEADAVIHTAFSHNFADYNDAVKLDREVIKTFGEALAQSNKPLIASFDFVSPKTDELDVMIKGLFDCANASPKVLITSRSSLTASL